MEMQVITRTGLGTILAGLATDMKQHVEELRELDAALGDGDLGVTVGLAADAVEQAVSAGVDDEPGGLLTRCGTGIRKQSPSTFGTLLGSAFVEAGRAVAGKRELTADDLGLMGAAAVAGVRRWGKAEVGDKTMLDALVPAVEAFASAAAVDLEAALGAAVDAARSGMEASTGMTAKHGRTSWHREKSVGVRDAGAAAVYFLVEAFARQTVAYLQG
jgi:phosphoenolpyruvate---glycerone phosphotransferase subunit DhaL